nr:hypothetical protein [Mucilaginibacter sp. L294]
MVTVSDRAVSALAVITSRYAVVIMAGGVSGAVLTGETIGTAFTAASFLQEDIPAKNNNNKSNFIFILP